MIIETILYLSCIIVGVIILVLLILNLYSYFYIIRKLRETNTSLFNELHELKRK